MDNIVINVTESVEDVTINVTESVEDVTINVPELNADQKRKITYGTADPTGGSDGDIYLQYED